MYDCYAAGIAMAGGVARPVPLRTRRPTAPGRGRSTRHELRAAITPRTKLLLLNTPHNPTGKVFTADELAVLAGHRRSTHDLLVLTDEVYEHLVFGGAEHLSIATLPGMRERTLVVSSAGKTFNVTGWKIGWICGPAPLVTAVRTAKQFLTYVNGGPFQPAVAAGLGLPDEYFTGAARDLEYRRDVLVEGLREAGLPVISPEATYFATVDVRPVQPDGDGLAFCRALPERAGVVAVPTGGVLRPGARPPGPAPGPVRVLQARRGAGRGRRAAGGMSGMGGRMRIAAVQHDIVWEDRDANFERLAPPGRPGGRRRGGARPAHRDLLHRLLDDAGDRRARGRPVGAVPGRPGRGRTASGSAGTCPEIAGRAGSDAALQLLRPRRARTAPRTATASCTRSPTPASTSGSARGRSR